MLLPLGEALHPVWVWGRVELTRAPLTVPGHDRPFGLRPCMKEVWSISCDYGIFVDFASAVDRYDCWVGFGRE